MDTAIKILFTDFRYIDCGDLVWRDPAGRPLGVSLPPGDPVPMRADSSGLPKGIRIESYPAEKHEAFERWPGWGRVVYEGGLYRSWYLRVDGHPLRGNGSEARVERPGTVEICSAESRDGYSWRERNRCPIEVPGQREFDGQTFLIDPDADAEERMKLVYCAHGPDEHRERLLAEQEKLPLWHNDPRPGCPAARSWSRERGDRGTRSSSPAGRTSCPGGRTGLPCLTPERRIPISTLAGRRSTRLG